MAQNTSKKPVQSYAVGDELAFHIGSIDMRWEIHKITKTTPSGRIHVGRWELNPDLTIRGYKSYADPYSGEPVTEEIRQEILRRGHRRILRTLDWNSLSDDKLSQIVDLIKSENP